MTANKCGFFRTSPLHYSTDKLWNFCRYTSLRDWKQVRIRSTVASHTGPTSTYALSNATYLLEFLVPDVNGYSAGWIHVKLCAKCTLNSCYRIFLHKLQNTPTPQLWGRLVVVMGWDCRLSTTGLGLFWTVSRRDRLGLTPNLSTRAFWPSPETSLERVGDGRRELRI
jgi:hypothetical protein